MACQWHCPLPVISNKNLQGWVTWSLNTTLGKQRLKAQMRLLQLRFDVRSMPIPRDSTPFDDVGLQQNIDMFIFPAIVEWSADGRT